MDLSQTLGTKILLFNNTLDAKLVTNNEIDFIQSINMKFAYLLKLCRMTNITERDTYLNMLTGNNTGITSFLIS